MKLSKLLSMVRKTVIGMNRINVMNQIQKKALPINQVLYLRYQIIFMFDNTKSYMVFAKNAL